MNKTQSQHTIILFDPDPYYRIGTELLLERVGLQLSKTVDNLADLQNTVKQVEAGKLNPDIVIVTDYMAKTFDDGAKIAAKFKEIGSKAKILAFVEDREAPKWADAHAIKAGIDPEKTLLIALGQLIGENFADVSAKADLN